MTIKKRLKIIGLTGGIGSGKSTVAQYLMRKDYVVLDADRIAREVVLPGSTVLAKLASIFGNEILQPDGSLDRKRLAAIVFTDPDKRLQMEGIMHKEILRLIRERIEITTRIGYDRLLFIDVPLLFETETGLLESMEEVWLVDADDEIRIQRVIRRDGSTREEIRRRINNQMSREEKKKRTNIVLDNSGSEENLYQQIDEQIRRHEKC